MNKHVIALKEANSAATLALWLGVLALVQICCGGVPVTEGSFDSVQSQLGFAAMACSLAGGLIALPCRLLIAMGVGGRRGGPRYDNFEARITAGTAARPELLPRIFLVGAVATAPLIVSQLLVIIAAMAKPRVYLPLIAVAGVFGLIAALAGSWYLRAYKNHGHILRTLPRPEPPPPGALPAAGSLESIALRFGRASRQACMLGALGGALWCIAIVFALIFSERLASLAGVPLAAVAGYACWRGYQGLHLFVRGRSPHVVGALLWGVLGGVAGFVPALVTLALAGGTKLGWWSFSPRALPELLRYGLGQPMGVCMTPFIAPLGLCGFTLTVFGRELTTKKSHDDRESEQQLAAGG